MKRQKRNQKRRKILILCIVLLLCFPIPCGGEESGIRGIKLPSTSPANARYRLADLLDDCLD